MKMYYIHIDDTFKYGNLISLSQVTIDKFEKNNLLDLFEECNHEIYVITIDDAYQHCMPYLNRIERQAVEVSMNEII
jgi:hypothetical protein